MWQPDTLAAAGNESGSQCDGYSGELGQGMVNVEGLGLVRFVQPRFSLVGGCQVMGEKHSRQVFYCWIIICSNVGCVKYILKH